MMPSPESRVPPVGSVPSDAVVRPLRRDAQRNRQVVLQAAQRMFALRGADCSFEDIAREAGVGVGTVYRRFPDRRTLIEAILEQRVADVDGAATAALTLEEPWAAAELFVGSVARMQLEDRGLRGLLHDHIFVSAGLALLRQRLTPAADTLAARLRDHGAAREDLTGQDLLVLIRMLGSLTPDLAQDMRSQDRGASRTGGTTADFARYLALVLDALRLPRP